MWHTALYANTKQLRNAKGQLHKSKIHKSCKLGRQTLTENSVIIFQLKAEEEFSYIQNSLQFSPTAGPGMLISLPLSGLHIDH